MIAGVESAPLAYTAGGPAVAVSAGLTVSDDDDDTVSGATAAITAGFDAADDVLSFPGSGSITGRYDAASGVLTLAGDAAPSDYQAALRAVTFATTDPAGSPAARTVAFTVTDSAGAASDPVTRTVDVATSVPPPTVVSHSYQAVGNTPLAVGMTVPGPAASIKGSLLSGDSDPDPSAALSVAGNTDPAHGAVVMNPDGTFTYTPDAGYSGPDSFSYTVAGTNAPGQTATAEVTVSVGPVVWYVDNSESGAGSGQGNTPFSTLAAAAAAAGPGDIIFLYQGDGPYSGGVRLQAGQDLDGQPNGLTVDGYSLLAPVGSAPVITDGAGDGIDLAQGSDVEGVDVAGASGNGIAALDVDDATVGTSTPVAVSGAGGDGIHVSGGSGTLDFGTTSVAGSAGHSVLVTGRSGGTVLLGGAVTGHGGGIALSGNAGAAVSFSGTLAVSTGASAAFSATGGGTVTATGTASTLATTTGTALSVQDTAIGGARPDLPVGGVQRRRQRHLAHRDRHRGRATVTGSGAAGTGGSIAGSTGAGIALSATAGPSFTDMIVKNNAGGGIVGTQVTGGLTLAGSTVSGNGTPVAVSGQNNDGLDFSGGLTGPVSITNSVISGSADNNAVITDGSGTLGLTVAGSTFASNSAGPGNDGLQVNANGTTDATVSVTDSTFTDNVGDAFRFATDAASSGTDSVTFTGNTLNSTAADVLGGGVAISPSGAAQATVTVNGNTIAAPSPTASGSTPPRRHARRHGAGQHDRLGRGNR